MFQIFFAIISRCLYLGNALQGFARGILALRIISSNLHPAISPAPPIAFIDAPFPVVGLPLAEEMPLYPSRDLIVGRQPPLFASPIPSYRSSLITASTGQLPIFIFPLFLIILAVVAGFILALPPILDYLMNVIKFVRSASHLPQWVVGPVRIYLMLNVANYLS
jgi:hypothetical protein